MFERLLSFRAVLNALSSNMYEVHDEAGNKMRSKIESLDFDKIEVLVTALKPIHELTAQLSSRDSSVADILPVYRMFTSKWPVDGKFENDEVGQIRQKITLNLEKRMKQMKMSK